MNINLNNLNQNQKLNKCLFQQNRNLLSKIVCNKEDKQHVDLML